MLERTKIVRLAGRHVAPVVLDLLASQRHADEAVDAGAVDALLALCRSPCDDGDGARSACTALRNMAFDAGAKAIIAEAGGVEVACSLLRAGATQSRSGPYALQAAALLGTLCWGSAGPFCFRLWAYLPTP